MGTADCGGDCTQAICCQATCASVQHDCSTTDWTRLPSQNDFVCDLDANCTDAECCQATCKTWNSCDSGWALKTTDPGCGRANNAGCKNTKCCDRARKCGDWFGPTTKCPANNRKRPDNTDCGGDCTQAICCQATCASVGHECGTAHWLRLGSQNGRVCASDAECTDAECCQATCKTWNSCDSGWALKTTDPGCGRA